MEAEVTRAMNNGIKTKLTKQRKKMKNKQGIW